MKSALGRASVVACCAMTLAACGGGGGGDGRAAPTFTINSASAKSIASDAFFSGFDLTFQFKLGIYSPFEYDDTPGETTSSCEISGTITTLFNDNDVSADLTTGDTFQVDYDRCVTSDGNGGSNELDGTINLDNISFDERGLFVDANTDYSFIGSTGATVTFASNISYHFLVENGGATSTCRIERGVHGSTVSSNGSVNEFQLSNLNMVSVFRNAGQSNSSVEYDFSYDMTSNSNVLNVDTTIALIDDDNAPFPNRGEMNIRGADSTSIQLVPVGGDSVRLDVDTNGDGNVDNIQNTSWQELR